MHITARDSTAAYLLSSLHFTCWRNVVVAPGQQRVSYAANARYHALIENSKHAFIAVPLDSHAAI
jgi:hypothetical protein